MFWLPIEPAGAVANMETPSNSDLWAARNFIDWASASTSPAINPLKTPAAEMLHKSDNQHEHARRWGKVGNKSEHGSCFKGDIRRTRSDYYTVYSIE